MSSANWWDIFSHNFVRLGFAIAAYNCPNKKKGGCLKKKKGGGEIVPENIKSIVWKNYGMYASSLYAHLSLQNIRPHKSPGEKHN